MAPAMLNLQDSSLPTNGSELTVDPPGERLDQELRTLEEGRLLLDKTCSLSEDPESTGMPGLDVSLTWYSSGEDTDDGERCSGHRSRETEDLANIQTPSKESTIRGNMVDDQSQQDLTCQAAIVDGVASEQQNVIQRSINQTALPNQERSSRVRAVNVRYKDQIQDVRTRSVVETTTTAIANLSVSQDLQQEQPQQHPDEALRTHQPPASGASLGIYEHGAIVVVHAVQVTVNDDPSLTVDETPPTSNNANDSLRPVSSSSRSKSLPEDEKSFLVKIMMAALFLNTVFAVSVVVTGFCLAGACGGGDDAQYQPTILAPTVPAIVPSLAPTRAPTLAPVSAPTTRSPSSITAAPVIDTGAVVNTGPHDSRPTPAPLATPVATAAPSQAPIPMSASPTQPTASKRLPVSVLFPVTVVFEVLLVLSMVLAYRRWKTKKINEMRAVGRRRKQQTQRKAMCAAEQ